MLLKAGSDPEAKTASTGSTPMHMAIKAGHPEAIRMLFEAGANPNSRMDDGMTALYRAAEQGCVACTRELLRGKVDPTLGAPMESNDLPEGRSVPVYAPLDATVGSGHFGAMRELIQKLGLEGCGGATRGEQALDAPDGKRI